jgi:ABC-type transport system substrate-binding protein
VGIAAKVEPCDVGRAMTLRGEGWKDGLLYAGYPIEANNAGPFLGTFGAPPVKFGFTSMAMSPEYEDLLKKLDVTYDDKFEQEVIKQLVMLAGKDAMVVPLFMYPTILVVPDYVHTIAATECGSLFEFAYEVWMSR